MEREVGSSDSGPGGAHTESWDTADDVALRQGESSCMVWGPDSLPGRHCMMHECYGVIEGSRHVTIWIC